MRNPDQYDTFSRFYDPVMGDRADSTARLRKLMRQAAPRARRILELGCGTGSVLKNLGGDYELWGIDLSRKMLRLAKEKVPQARLSRQSMVSFRLPLKFDVIFCVYDSINHLTRFADWQETFAKVRSHLAEGGVFIFDINTQRKLDRHMAEPPWVHLFGRNLLIMDVIGKPGGASTWNIKVFERINADRYRLHEENIAEVAFPTQRIVLALKRHFASARIVDAEGKHPPANAEKFFFICKA